MRLVARAAAAATRCAARCGSPPDDGWELSMSRLFFSLFSLSTFALLWPLAGCVTETSSEPKNQTSGAEILDFTGPGPRTMFVNTGSYHGVTLLFEIDPASDLPKGNEGEPPEFRTAVIPYRDGGREVYRVLNGLHEVSYSMRSFETGGFRYPEHSGASLYVFKERSGPFSFVFHGQPILVESRRAWKPSIWYHIEHERDTAESPDSGWRTSSRRRA